MAVQLSSLVDPFTTGTLNTQWNSVTGTVTLVPSLGMAQLACPTVSGTVNTLGALGPYDATSGALYAQVTPVLRGNGGTKTIIKLAVDANNWASMRLDQGVFKLIVEIAGADTVVTLPTYDPTQHAWWRLRESGGTWFADASADGYAWTTLGSATYSWSPKAMQVLLQAAVSDTEPSGLFAGFQCLNTMQDASGLMPSWPQIRFQVAFNQGGLGAATASAAFVELGTRLQGNWSAGQAGRQNELDAVQSGQLSVTLNNDDGAFDSTNPSSPYYPNVLPGRLARMQAVWPPSRNLLPQNVSCGSSLTGMANTLGPTLATATGLAPAPTGHKTAHAWTLPASTGTAAAFGIQDANTGNAGWTAADPSALSVTAGASYTFTAWVAQASGGDATLQVAHRISWYDITGARIVASVGTGVTAPVLGSSWALMTLSMAAPAGAISARVAVQNTTVPASNSTVYVTAWQMEKAAAATPWTPGGVVYPLWQGYVDRWEQKWLGTARSQVDITCVDALAQLSQTVLKPNFQASLAALGPNFMYPFNEEQGSTTFADAMGRRSPRTIGTSVLGAGSGSVTAGSSVTGGGSVGSDGPVVTVTNPTPASSTSTAGRFISTSASNTFPPASGGWTRVICFRTTVVPASGNYQTLWASVGPGFFGFSGSQGVFILGVDNNGYGFGWVTNAANTATSLIRVPDVVCTDGNWHVIVVQMSADGKQWTVAVDNHGYVATTTLDYHPTGTVTDGIGALEYRALGQYLQAFSGDLAYATEFGYAIGNAAAFDLGTGFSTGWAGESSTARAQRILSLASYGGNLAAFDASTAMGGANFAGQDAASAIQVVGDSEGGQIYPTADGGMRLDSRIWRYAQSTPAFVLGENTAAGEIPYSGTPVVSLDTDHIYNDVIVSNSTTPGATQQADVNVINSASVSAYSDRSYSRTINVQDQSIPQQAANFLASQFAQPLPRIARVTVDPVSNPAVWSQVLQFAFGTRLDIKRRSNASSNPVITVATFLEALTWKGGDDGRMQADLQLSAAQPYIGWGVASSLHTTVKTASTAGTATVTLNPLTGSALNPAGAVLAAGTTLTLGYGTPNAETLTVQSVAATSPGYASVAVTFTSNTAHNHAVGEMVCQPQPGSLTLPAYVQAGYPASLDGSATLTATGPRAAY